ncbi:MAG: hypothetical protein FWB74_02430 [Defluviitaleaceae bacterium]|nr:hypothetical protein [Defluviitaleaceae bacterium]
MKNRKRFLGSLVAVIASVVILFSVPFFAFNGSDDKAVSGIGIFSTNSFEELLSFMLYDAKEQMEYFEPSVEEWTEMQEILLAALKKQGGCLEEYLEDFDYLVDFLSAYYGHFYRIKEKVSIVRSGIENFFHMNEMVFSYILMSTFSAELMAGNLSEHFFVVTHTGIMDLTCLCPPMCCIKEHVENYGYFAYSIMPNSGNHITILDSFRHSCI